MVVRVYQSSSSVSQHLSVFLFLGAFPPCTISEAENPIELAVHILSQTRNITVHSSSIVT